MFHHRQQHTSGGFGVGLGVVVVKLVADVRRSPPPLLADHQHLSAHILRAAGIGRIILVTSSPHEYRAAQEYRDAGFEVVPAPAGVSSPRETGPLRWVPGPAPLMRSNRALYELIGEPVRRIQAALGVRERFDRKTAGDSAD